MQFSGGKSIADMLDCLYADVLEEVALLEIEMQSRRQLNSKHAPHYPLIDALCRSAAQLSKELDAEPDFALVSMGLDILANLSGAISADIVRKRHRVAQRRKTRP